MLFLSCLPTCNPRILYNLHNFPNLHNSAGESIRFGIHVLIAVSTLSTLVVVLVVVVVVVVVIRVVVVVVLQSMRVKLVF